MSTVDTKQNLQEQREDAPRSEEGGQYQAPVTPKPKKKKAVSGLQSSKTPTLKHQSAQPEEDSPTDAIVNATEKAEELSIDEKLNHTLPAGKREIEKDFALSSLSDRNRMPAAVTGERNTKEVEEGRQGEDEKQSLKIKISLDLDVEVHLSARIKGDITIGLL